MLKRSCSSSIFLRINLARTIWKWCSVQFAVHWAWTTTQQFRGLYFGPKTIFIPPPPSENDIFSPSHKTLFFDSHCGLFALILPYFAFILPCFFPFSHFLSPFLIFLSPFFLFLLHFPPFSLPLFIFFPPNDIGWYLFPSPGGAYFPIYRPLQQLSREVFVRICNLSVVGITTLKCSTANLRTKQFKVQDYLAKEI